MTIRRLKFRVRMTIRRLKNSHFNSLKKGASHPVTLLLIGAILSSLIIPYYTRQWQDRQKELELKTNLTNQISKAVEDIIIITRIVQLDSNTTIDYETSFIDWQLSGATIGSEIQSYFPDTPIRKNWDELSGNITEFVSLDNAPLSKEDPKYNYSVCKRIEHVLNIHSYLEHNNSININRTELYTHDCLQTIRMPHTQELAKYSPNVKDIDWNSLVHTEDIDVLSHGVHYGDNWFEIEKQLRYQKDNLIQSILNTPMPVFK
jgi:hypothetical protein